MCAARRATGNRASLLRAVTGALLIAFGVAFSLLSKQWIEETLGFEPDGGNGMLELAIAVVPIIAGVTLLAGEVLAHRRRLRDRTAVPNS